MQKLRNSSEHCTVHTFGAGPASSLPLQWLGMSDRTGLWERNNEEVEHEACAVVAEPSLLTQSLLRPQRPHPEALQYMCEQWASQYERVKKLLAVAPRSQFPQVQQVIVLAERLYRSAVGCVPVGRGSRVSVQPTDPDLVVHHLKCNVELLQSALVALADCATARRDKTLRTVMGLLFNAGEHILGLLHQRPPTASKTTVSESAEDDMATLLALLERTPGCGCESEQPPGAISRPSHSSTLHLRQTLGPSSAANISDLHERCRRLLAKLLRGATLETFGSCFVWLVWNHRDNVVEVLETRDATCPLLLEDGLASRRSPQRANTLLQQQQKWFPNPSVSILFGCDMFEHQYIGKGGTVLGTAMECDGGDTVGTPCGGDGSNDEFPRYVQHVCETLPIEFIASRVRSATRAMTTSHL